MIRVIKHPQDLQLGDERIISGVTDQYKYRITSIEQGKHKDERKIRYNGDPWNQYTIDNTMRFCVERTA
jgi:hypothetical protein